MFFPRLAVLVLVAAALGIPTAAPTQAQAAAPTCTQTGTAGADRLVGTSRKDVLCGKGGNDVLIGKGGNDVLVGGGGKDRMVGGAGDDRHDGGAGFDTVSYDDRTTAVTARLDGTRSGVSGERDAVVASEALIGGDGNDTLFGDEADNTIAGGDGNDALIGGEGIDDLDGGAGINTCDSTPGEPVESSCRHDVSGPEIVSLTTSQESYEPGATFTITAQITDDSGVDLAGAVYYTADVQNDFCDQFMTKVGGTSRNGTWEMTCTVPASVRNGVYTATPFAGDIMGNWTNTNGGSEDDTRATFTIFGGTDDGFGPSIESVTTSQETYEPGDPFVLSIHVVDPSGVDHVSANSSIDHYTPTICDGGFELASGTPQDGVWEQTCTTPALIRNGTYVVTPYARDAAGNWTNSSGGVLDDTRGGFTVAGASDDADPPQVVSMETDAASYAPGDPFTLTMHVLDASGADLVGAYFTRSGVQNDFCDQTLTLTAGTPQDGTWTLQCAVPSTAPVGSYTAHPYARDVIGNYAAINGGPPIGLSATFDIVE